MKKKFTILQKSLQVFLLLLAIVASTPKKFLHDAIASHKHCGVAKSYKNNQAELTSKNFNCDIDNLVVDIPFTASQFLQFHFQEKLFIERNIFFLLAFKKQSATHTALRGPPTNV